MLTMFRNLAIGKKISVAFLVVFLVALVQGGAAFFGNRRLQAELVDIGTVLTPSIMEGMKIRVVANRQIIRIYSHAQIADADSMASIEATLKAEQDSLDAACKRYEPLVDDPEELARFEEFRTEWAAMLEEQEKVLELSRSGQKAAATAKMEATELPRFWKATAAIARCVEINSEQISHAQDSAESLVGKLIVGITAIGLVLIAFLVGLRSLLLASIAVPLRRLAQMVGEIGQGDLRSTAVRESRDEVGDLQEAVGGMVVQLRGSMGSIRGESTGLASAAEELSAVAAEMDHNSTNELTRAESLAAASTEMDSSLTSVAAATEQSSTNLVRIVASIEEMAASVNEIAQGAERSRHSAKGAVDTVAKSSSSVEELSRASNEISKVIETIVEIAEQTKLLALNATIEAARAGEAGKGFAVVASEVKELAKGTADATDDIRKRIEAMQVSTRETIDQIKAIDRSIVDVDELVGGIAAAVEQQSATTREIAGNASEASRGITEATRMVAQVASTSKDVSAQAETLRDGARQSRTISGQTRTTSMELARMAGDLKSQVGRYRLE